jgi:hypothetical protein
MADDFDITGGWEQSPRYDVFVIEGVPTAGWIHDVAVWTHCAASLQPLVDAVPDPTGVRSHQSAGDDGWLPVGALTWSEAGHRAWTTKHAHLKHRPGYWFSGTECASPTWREQDRRRIHATLAIGIEASLACTYHGAPRGARHWIRVALRDGWLERIGEVVVRTRLLEIAARLTAISAWHARRTDLDNLPWPWHPSANKSLEVKKGDTRWAAIPGIPVQSIADPIPLPPDSFTSRTARHADGRAITVGMIQEGLVLSIRAPDGEVIERRRRVKDPDEALAATLAELVSDGFVVEPAPKRTGRGAIADSGSS